MYKVIVFKRIPFSKVSHSVKNLFFVPIENLLHSALLP